MLAISLIILSSLIIPGIILKLKALFAGKKGPGIFQPWKDLWVLIHKGSVFSSTTSFVFQIAPVISLACIVTACLVVPFEKSGALLHFEGDFLFFTYIMALGKFFMIVAALDTGSSFEGMGANREALFSMLVEPAFFLMIAALSSLTGYFSFNDVFAHLYFSGNYSWLFLILVVFILVQLAMIENSRLPVDDPKTHLELTMIHEVMVLDYSGFDMALIHLTSYLRFAIFGTLIAVAIIQPQWDLTVKLIVYFLVQATFASIIGSLESFRARNRMKMNAQYILTFTSVALLAYILVMLMTNKLI
jgi:formate hydrogenlyase subunit 4